MTTSLHDKMLAAIDAYFSASDAVEEEVAENLLLDVRDAINKHKLAADSITEGLRLDDWDKIGCVNHDCDKCKALAEQPAPATELREQEPVPAAIKTVIQAMQQDPEYAWGWHCNIAMSFVDAGGDHYVGNQGAARFMKLLANVEPAHALPTSQAPTQEPEQPAKRHGYKEAYIEAMVASNEAGFVGLSAAETIRELANMLDKRAEQPAQQEPAFRTSYAYTVGFEDGKAQALALAEQPAQQDSAWCMKMNGCKTKCEDCPDEAPKIGCVNHDCDQCKARKEPESFEQWLAMQHGDPEELGFLQALRIAYIAGQDSITKGNT